MASAVDLGTRTGGLLPLWLFVLLVALWIGAIVLAIRYPPHRWPELPRGLTAVGILILGNVLFFWRPLFTGAHVPRGGGDLNSFFFTLHAYSAERLTSGEIPLWNPFLHGGMPHLGNFQAAVLYPPNLIAYLIAQPFSYSALEWLAILHFMIASIGVYVLLRTLGANRIGAVAGGLIFAYAGFMVAHLGHYSMISAAAWLPWLLWAIALLVRAPSWGRAALLALPVFLTATGGHQQTLLFVTVVAGIWWLFLTAHWYGVRIPGVGPPEDPQANRRAWNRIRSRAGLVRIVQFGLGLGAGLAMAAPMILPSLQLARRSVRSTLSFEQASEFSVQPVALLQLVLPTVFGSNPTDHWGTFSSGEIWGYAGAVTLVLAGLALVLRQSPHRLFFALLAVLSLVYALGSWAPLHGWFYQFVPLFDLIRAPARSYMFLNLAVATLAGLAISDLSRTMPHTGLQMRRALRRTLQALALVIGAVALIALPVFYARVLGVNDPPNRPVITVDNLWMLLLVLSLLLAVLWFARSRSLRGAALGIALAVVVVLDLFSATMPFNPTGEDLVAGYRAPEVSALLAEEWDETEPFRVGTGHPGLLPNFGMVHGVHVAAGVFDPMQPAAYTRLHNVLAENPSLPAYDMLNVRYRIQSSEAEDPPGFEPALDTGGGIVVWERETALPRAWFVTEVVDIDREAALNTVQDEAFDPAQTVLIPNPPLAPDGDATGLVEMVSYEPERIVLDVESDGSGYLVLADGYDPDWSATVDGSAETVLAANHGLRAIPVEGGTSRVELRYEPALVTAGAIIGLVGALLIAGLLAAHILLAARGGRSRGPE